MPRSTKTSKRKKLTEEQERKRYLIWSILIPLFLVLFYMLWHYRTAIFYYTKAFFTVSQSIEERDRNKFDARNVFLMTAHDDKVFGIDVSQYQANINWDEVHLINDRFVVDFIFIRSTMGEKNVDKMFKKNWEGAKRIHKLRGAYHYFRPNENSILQADNFIRTVKLRPGDLPPVLDIEERPKNQSMDKLKLGLQRWLDRVEQHYKVRPIIYSGDSYFTDFLESEFSNYTLWIANYNFWVEEPKGHWDFWQFSEKGSVKGIKGFVDLNMYQHSIEDLEALCVPFE